MRVLITGAATSFGQALAAGLGDRYELRLTDRDALESEHEFVQSSLSHDEITDALVAGVDAIVHQAYIPRANDGETTWLDYNARRTYNLLLAAVEAEVGHVVVLSTLDLFTPYDEDMTVGEQWKPLPSCAPAVLGAHLCEFTAREFAHSHALKITVARLGHLVRGEEVAGAPYDPMWLDERDAITAISRILAKGNPGRRHQFGVLHIQSDGPDARFSVEAAKSHLDFEPQYNFEDHS